MRPACCLVSLLLVATTACAKHPPTQQSSPEGSSTQLTAASSSVVASSAAAAPPAPGKRVVVASPGGDAAPSRPFDKAPVRFEVLAIDAERNELEVRAYNFSERELAAFDAIVRYRDASGKALSSAGSEVVPYAASGLSYRMAPKAWTRLVLDHVIVPPGATTAEILLRGAKATARGGLTLDPVPVFASPFTSTWPEAKK